MSTDQEIKERYIYYITQEMIDEEGPESHITKPGIYFSNETEGLECPFETEEIAIEAFKDYCKILTETYGTNC